MKIKLIILEIKIFDMASASYLLEVDLNRSRMFSPYCTLRYHERGHGWKDHSRVGLALALRDGDHVCYRIAIPQRVNTPRHSEPRILRAWAMLPRYSGN